MPVVIPRKQAPAPAPTPAVEKPPEPPALTRADVEAMLSQRDAMWAQQIQAVTQAMRQSFESALQTMAEQRKPSNGFDHKVEYRPNGSIEIIRSTPRK